MTAETVVIIVGILTLVVICYQTSLLFAQLGIMRKQHEIVTHQLGLKAELAIVLRSEEPLRSYTPPSNPSAYRLSLYLTNDGSKAANDCHIQIMLPVKWHEASANAKSKFTLNQGPARVEGVDYFTFDLDINTINAEDNQPVLSTAFSGTPGNETVLWTIASSEGNFPTEGFGKLTVRLG
jgi:hypothetical protein